MHSIHQGPPKRRRRRLYHPHRTRLSLRCDEDAVDIEQIASKPKIWRPPQARQRSAVEDYHLTRPQTVRLLDAAAGVPRWPPRHILQLTWDRIDFQRGSINLDDPGRKLTANGRARVAINETVAMPCWT